MDTLTAAIDTNASYVQTAHVPPCEGATLVRTGLLTAFVVERDGQRVLLAPLAYDLDIVLAVGERPVEEGADLMDAVTDWYGDSFAGWCARKDAERAANSVPVPKRRPMSSGIPTYDGSRRFVPFGWMGRDPSFVR
jgi:hypothetical protein